MKNYSALCDKILSVLDTHSVKSLKKDYSTISAKYRSENIKSTKVVDTVTKVQSYLSTRMPETTWVVYDVLSKIDRVVGLDIDSVLDVGSGTGATMWALDNFMFDGVATAVELDSNMLNCALVLCEDLSPTINYVECSVLSNKFDSLPKADLVIESFMLNELSDIDRLKAVDNMCKKTSKYLVLIEPGTPVSFDRLSAIKEHLLAKGMHLTLPCPHSEKCGLNGDFCNFSVRVNRSSLHRLVKSGTLSYSDEKYFYMVFSVDKVSKSHSSTILRHPVYRKNCIDLKLCNADGSVTTTTITKSDKLSYKLAKDYRHGDILDS